MELDIDSKQLVFISNALIEAVIKQELPQKDLAFAKGIKYIMDTLVTCGRAGTTCHINIKP